jgi:heterodisulfide reductase subunit A
MHNCRECILTPKLEELLQNPNLEILLETEVTNITGERGDFQIELENNGTKKNLNVNAIILATGSKTFDPNRLPEYGYRNEDVITFLELEKLIVAQRLDGNDLKRPSDGKIPKRINFILCVGSRDSNRGNPHCSIVCCTYAIGQAKDLKKRYPNTEILIHYMDLRAAYRGFEEFYKETQELGVKFIRGRVADVQKVDGKLILRSENVDLGEPMEMESDLVILAVGQEMLNLPIASNGFIQDALPSDFTEKSGISVIGCALGPRGIRYSVKEAINSVDEIIEFFRNNGSGRIDISAESRIEPITAPSETHSAVAEVDSNINVGGA